MYDTRIIQSKTVRYSSFGSSESITKLYAINESRQTIVIVSLDSSCLGSTQTTDQHINNINSIGNITLKNRIVCSPISLNMSETNGVITDNLISFFSNIAKNNLGMVIVGNACVSNIGKGAANEIVIGKKIHLKQLSK